MTVPLCYYGSPDPLPPRRQLRAGPLTAVYEAGDLRYVRVGGVEVCRRWYAAVRDHNWGTVPGVISDETIEETTEWTRVRYTSTHRRDDIHFVWQADIFLSGGRVAFEFIGEAKSDFRRNRIGFCILHPPETCAGQSVTLFHPDHSETKTAFPVLIAPQNPFQNHVALFHTTASGLVVQWRFEGDEFETEDQRNWIDASYKTFCTPLGRPFPVEVRAGEQVRQTVTLAVRGGTTELPATTEATLARGDGPPARLPAIGLGVPSHDRPLHPHELGWLKQLRPTHLRADLDLTRPGWADHLRAAAAHAAAVGCGLELAVTVSADVWAETAALIPELLAIDPPVVRVLVVRAADWSTHAEDVGPVVEAFARASLHPDIFGGTTANFTELNRRRPPLDWVQGVAYSVQPQEHASDNASLAECCGVLADTVRSARAFCGDRPLSVGPVTLRKRVNPYATGPWQPHPPDPRQPTLFGAGWTLGALKYLAESGVDWATFYETIGPRGVTADGRVFPLFHALADATEFAGAEVLPVVSSDPLAFDALMLRKDAVIRLMVANLTAERQLFTITGLPDGTDAFVRLLDETTFEQATTDPDEFRDRVGEPYLVRGGTLKVALDPYAYARLDCE